MSIAIGNVIVILDRYDATHDNSVLPLAAWICKLGIQDIMLSGNMSPMYTINIVVNHHAQKMTVQDAYLRSLGRLMMIADELGETYKEYISDIINGGKSFSAIDSQLGEEDKQKFLKLNITFE